MTKRMRDSKQALKDSIREEENYQQQLEQIEREKRQAIKALNDQPEFAELSQKERRENADYVAANKEITDRFSDRVEDVRFKLTELYDERRRRGLPDYDIFMAIAEDIGYDATNRHTKANELDPIAKELTRFIEAVEEGKA